MVRYGSPRFAQVRQGSARVPQVLNVTLSNSACLQSSARFPGVSAVLSSSERFFEVLHGSKVL